MLRLKNHPFAVEAYFDFSIVLTYAIAKEELQELIPACLELDTFADKWAFVALALVSTEDLRPKGFPRFMGNDFFLIGFRVFVCYTDKRGKRLRGLYILKSETNKRKMSALGNIFTHYNYSTTDVSFRKEGEGIVVRSNKSALDIRVNAGKIDIKLPRNSPFSDWKEARRFAGPLPFTFTYIADRKEVLIIEGVRQHWHPQPLQVEKAEVGFVEEGRFGDIHLANAFVVSSIPYSWKKGRIERWT